MKKEKIGILLAFLVAFGGIAVSYIRMNRLETRVPAEASQNNLNRVGFKVGDVFSRSITVSDLQGREFLLSDVFKGKKTFVIFFSAECPICLQDAPRWEELYERFKTKNLVFLGLCVSSVNDPRATKQFVGYNRLKFPVAVVQVAELHKMINSFLVPEIIVFNDRGIVDTAWVGGLEVGNRFSKVDDYLRAQE